MSKTYFHDFHRELDDGSEQTVTVEYTATPYDPGCTYGLPEDCYPPEGGEIGIIEAWLEPQGTKIDLPDDERERWEQWLMENPDLCAHGDDDGGDC